MADHFDDVIVGVGSADSVISGRLASEPDAAPGEER